MSILILLEVIISVIVLLYYRRNHSFLKITLISSQKFYETNNNLKRVKQTCFEKVEIILSMYK